MKKVLLIVAVVPKEPVGNMNWTALRDELRTKLGDSIRLDMTSLTNLVYDISSGPVITDSLTGSDIASYDFVVLRNVGKNPDLGITAAHYLYRKNVPFIDSYLLMRGSGKLACAMMRTNAGLSTPRTVYAKAGLLGDYVEANKPFKYPFILKADDGKKGRDNYLVKDSEELKTRLSESPQVRFIAQEYIENDGDLRVLVLDGKVGLIIRRTAAEGSHLNNTSQGGEAEILNTSSISEDVTEDAIKAAEVEGLEVAGVDIIFDKNTGKHYFLEVNRAPQLGTGSFPDEKISAYAEMIKNRVEGR